MRLRAPSAVFFPFGEATQKIFRQELIKKVNEIVSIKGTCDIQLNLLS